jgi:hypothetical protein
MIDPELKASQRLQLRHSGISRWNNEGGAGPGGRMHAGCAATYAAARVAPLTNAELVQLQIRVIALERIVMALLAHPADGQLNVIREMAAYIYPRAGHTPHPLTIGAAGQMISLLQGAAHFRTRPGTGA